MMQQIIDEMQAKEIEGKSNDMSDPGMSPGTFQCTLPGGIQW